MENENLITRKGTFEENALKDLQQDMKTVLEKLNEIDKKINNISAL